MDKLAIANGGHIMNGDSNSSPIHPHHNHHSHLHQHHPHQAGHETNLVLPPILPPLSSTLHGDANAPNGVSLPQIPAYYHGPHTQHDHHQVQEHQPLDAGAEQGLAALGDSPDGAKPFYPYSTLIRYAIKGSPQQKLLLEEIYIAIIDRFPYFKDASSGWKNSIRHNLSLNPCFEKIPRPLTDKGKGSYWTVNDSVDPRTGVHRIRKKKGRSSSTRGVGKDGPSGALFEGTYATGEEDIGGRDYRYGNGEAEEGGSRTHYGYSLSLDAPIGYTASLPIPPDGIRYADEEDPEGDHSPSPSSSTHLDPASASSMLSNPRAQQNNWRAVWHEELARLHDATSVQDRAGMDMDWYRMMVERVRGAFMVPPPQLHHHHAHAHGSYEGAQEQDHGHGSAIPTLV